jgi:hypothetical protein
VLKPGVRSCSCRYRGPFHRFLPLSRKDGTQHAVRYSLLDVKERTPGADAEALYVLVVRGSLQSILGTMGWTLTSFPRHLTSIGDSCIEESNCILFEDTLDTVAGA